MADARRASPAASVPAADPELAELRQQIDAVDRALLEQLNARARLVRRVGELKERSGASVYEPSREQEIVDRLAAANAGPFPDAGLAPVFREIISATRSLEAALPIAYLGPEGTFTHLAARGRFGALAALVGLSSIEDVFAAVEREKARLGVVPVENTTEGIVTQTFDALARFDVTLCGEALLPISHHLLSRSGRRADVRRVASHPQVLAQCRQWLDRNLPDVERVETPSSAAAARAARDDGAVAAIGSAIAGDVYELRTVEAAIEDRSDNCTRFLVLGSQQPPPSGDDLTSALFTLRRDEAGALHRLLAPFARCGVSLTSIQLRPLAGKPWEYLFFLDVEGHRSEAPVAEALESAAGAANSYRVLGSFPRAERLDRGNAGRS